MDSLAVGWPGEGHHFWGFIQNNWHLIQERIENEVDWYFWDMPYWGRWCPDSETFYWRASKNSIHETQVVDRPSDRFAKWNLNVKPWRSTGSEIVVCPSSDTMTRWCTGKSEEEWTADIVEQLKKYTDRPIRVRPKPRAGKTSGPVAAQIAGIKSFREDIQDAWAVVTSVSMCAVEAISEGVPVFCDAKSFASPVSETLLSNIEQPKRTDTQAWFNHLAYCQFTQQEIRSGLAHRILVCKKN